MRWICVLSTIALFVLTLLATDGASAFQTSDRSSLACVPLSCIYSLKHGGDNFKQIYATLPGDTAQQKCSNVVKLLGLKQSEEYPGFLLVRPDGGVGNSDVDDFFNAILAKYGGNALRGEFANKLEGEFPREHLIRLHKCLASSIANGVPPIVTFRSLEPEQNRKDGLVSWKAAYAHAVTITDIPTSLEDHQEGFQFDYIESKYGTKKQGYLHIEKYRDYSTRLREDSETLRNKPFLSVITPSMPLGTQDLEWHARGVIILMYIAGDF